MISNGSLIFPLCLPFLAQAINMTFYNPQCDVDYVFGPFYEQLLKATEDPTSTSSMIDFFTPNGTLRALNNTARGPDQIIQLRQSLLPVDGSVQWNHYPNITFVSAETAVDKNYQVSGILHSITGGNCSTTYFSTRFTVTKNETTGIPSLGPHSGSLIDITVSSLVTLMTHALRNIESANAG
ncbi:hypothetical protein PVAG01_01751 [Phlyctema vagabunda]|uniref:Uncharacterized protein n=1 Tax=Phlyctema vagabunda TaxID=108571 RepID=A0ABR4PYP4_9HELO